MVWTTNPSRKTPVTFFGHGHEYRVLGLIPTDHPPDRRPPIPTQRIFLLGSDRLGRDQWSQDHARHPDLNDRRDWWRSP